MVLIEIALKSRQWKDKVNKSRSTSQSYFEAKSQSKGNGCITCLFLKFSLWHFFATKYIVAYYISRDLSFLRVQYEAISHLLAKTPKIKNRFDSPICLQHVLSPTGSWYRPLEKEKFTWKLCGSHLDDYQRFSINSTVCCDPLLQ